MEEYDDLSVGPKDGILNLSHNTWKILPPELNDFSRSLLHLNLSNNLLTKIPESIGNLILLKSLDVSLNQVTKIDGAIGKCLRLRKLNVEKNRLECLPDELSHCILLEELLAKDNKLTALPECFENLIAIEKIDVRSNELNSLPLKLCRMPTLSELLCDDNPNLVSAPNNMRGNSNLLMWCLEMQQKYEDVIHPKTNTRDELHLKSTKLQNDIIAAQTQIQQLESEIAQLQEERPDDYIYWKGRVMTVIEFVLKKIKQLWQRAKRAYIAWREKRKTHPLY